MSDEKRPFFDPHLSMGNIIVLVVLGGTIIGGWYGFEGRLSQVEDRASISLEALKENRVRLEARVTRIENERDDTRDRLTRLEIQLQNQTEILKRIEAGMNGDHQK